MSPILAVLILWLAGLCAAAQFAKFAIALPEIAQSYPDAGASLGFTVSLISLVGALFGLWAGTVANRISLHTLLLFGLISGAGISLVQSIGLPLSFLLVSRVLEGISHLAIVITAPTLIALVSNDQWRSSAMTLWGTFFGVSFALTAILGIPLIETQGVGALFLVHGLIMGVVALSVMALSSSPDLKPVIDSAHCFMAAGSRINPATENETTLNSDSRKFRQSLAAILAEYKRAVVSPYISAPATGWLFYTLTFVALLAILPDLATHELRSITATLLPIASIISSMSVGVVLLMWLSAVQVICIGFMLAIVTATILILMPETLICSVLLFASLGLVQGASFAAVPQLNPASTDQALANGAMAQTGNIGNLLGTPVMIGVLMISNLQIMLSVIVLCYLMALSGHLLLSARRHRMH